MRVNGVDQALKLLPSLLQHLLHFIANKARQRLNRKRLARTMLTGGGVAEGGMRAQGMLVQVQTVARLRLRHAALVEADAEVRGTVHEHHERMRVPAHAADAAGHAHELQLVVCAAPAVVREDVVALGLLVAQARAIFGRTRDKAAALCGGSRSEQKGMEAEALNVCVIVQRKRGSTKHAERGAHARPGRCFDTGRDSVGEAQAVEKAQEARKDVSEIRRSREVQRRRRPVALPKSSFCVLGDLALRSLPLAQNHAGLIVVQQRLLHAPHGLLSGAAC